MEKHALMARESPYEGMRDITSLSLGRSRGPIPSCQPEPPSVLLGHLEEEAENDKGEDLT